ncbi:hypothetical protein [Brasilonema sp. UFV-L1]|uniref:hypothetical protein n=1 Tax=Brasilonema sp. UFV-L1 TaxID=2234130 RepID=UPI00145E9743|nr:hypothetical protein [Brasilonema sp. UFV-L1]NMG08448.1 hypothetical protein [Brasilonema sp. UFV-L1]
MSQQYQKLSQSAKFLGAICGGLLIGLPVIPQAIAQQYIPQQPRQQSSSKINPCPSIFYEEPHNSRVLVPQGCKPNAFTQQSEQQGRVTPGNVSNEPVPTQQQVDQGVGGDTPYNRSENSTESYSSQSQSTTTSTGQDTNTSSSEIRTSTRQGTTDDYTVRTSSQSQNNPSSQQRQNSNITPPLPEQNQSPIALVTPANGKVSVRLRNNTNARINYEALGYTGQRVLSGRTEVVLQNLPLPVTISTVRQDNGFVKVTPTSTESGLIELSLDEQRRASDKQGVVRIQKDGKVFLN